MAEQRATLGAAGFAAERLAAAAWPLRTGTRLSGRVHPDAELVGQIDRPSPSDTLPRWARQGGLVHARRGEA